jgi:predicted transglutaminase-like cysteine proteinase
MLARFSGGLAPCPQSEKACAPWHALKAAMAGVDDRLTLLTRVNDALNQLEYWSDSRVWAAGDYWATPAEFLKRGAGDCEDYAIAKFFLLRELGVPDADMRIAVVRDVARNLTHAVLVVQTEAGPFILDNVVEELLPAARAPQYRTLLSLNQTSVWLYLPAQGSSAAGG